MELATNHSILTNALKEQNPKAFRSLYDIYWKRMFVYAHKIIADQQICEDLIQEIFIRLWEKAPETDIQNIEGYLFRALKYKIANALRDTKYIYVNEGVIERIPSENNPKTILEFKDLEKQVMETMENLPKKCRNVFYLSRVEQYNNHEIAQELNISVRTVETHISNALKYFKLHISRHAISLLLLFSFPF